MAKKLKSTIATDQVSAFEIVEASTFDLSALAQLFNAYRQFYEQESDLQGASTFLAARMKQKDSILFMAIDEEGMPVGFAQLYPLFSSVGMKKTWLLNDLFVLPDFRGQGVSRLLISQCKELARNTGANGLQLETGKTNAVGNRLYPAEGFEINKLSNFYFWKCS